MAVGDRRGDDGGGGDGGCGILILISRLFLAVMVDIVKVTVHFALAVKVLLGLLVTPTVSLFFHPSFFRTSLSNLYL